MPVTARAYAKINLTLDVFNKRSDGYHSLASVMQTISLHDVITIQQSPETGVHFTCTGPYSEGIPTDGSNLVVRAAESAMAAAHYVGGVEIQLDKRIPSQAGLGGGSSDAACTLLAVCQLCGLDLGPSTLHRLAEALGSDVPFFLTGGTAVVRGRGENIAPIADCAPMWLVVVKPVENVSTGWAYGRLDEMTDRVSYRATSRMEEAIKTGDIQRMIAGQCNDFEAAVFSAVPAIAWLRDQLQMAGAVTAHLCGSGSAVYGVMPGEEAARRAVSLLRAQYPHSHVARTVAQAEACSAIEWSE